MKIYSMRLFITLRLFRIKVEHAWSKKCFFYSFSWTARESIILFLVLILKWWCNLGKYRRSFLLSSTYEECKWHFLIKTSAFIWVVNKYSFSPQLCTQILQKNVITPTSILKKCIISGGLNVGAMAFLEDSSKICPWSTTTTYPVEDMSLVKKRKKN